MKTTSLLGFALSAWVMACSSGSGSGSGTGGTGGAGGSAGSGGSAGFAGSGGTAGSGGSAGSATGGSAGSAGSAGSGGQAGAAGSTGQDCPHVDLGSGVPISYNGNTDGLNNIVESQRLEWQQAPDDALLFTAPSAGTYKINMPSEPSTNGGCGASIQEYGDFGTNKYYDASWCPASGSVQNIDGIFAAGGGGDGSEMTLTQGQKLLIWVSCSYWSSAQSGAYTLTIDKL